MDSFAMLHYWRAAAASKPCTTIVSSILRSSDEDDDGDDDEDGPFIDLEFSIPNVESSEMQPKPQVSTSLLKSATKLRIFTLGSKKIKTLSLEPDAAAAIAASSKPQQSRKLFVGFRAEDAPLVSLFTRDNSSKPTTAASAAGEAAEEDKKFSKEVLQRYLNKIKRLRFSDGQRAPHRRLGKSRSAVAAVRSPPRRRDDSLLQQEDGIQSAIAHCKRSFNAERGMESPPVRSNSDPGEGKLEKCKG